MTDTESLVERLKRRKIKSFWGMENLCQEAARHIESQRVVLSELSREKYAAEAKAEALENEIDELKAEQARIQHD